MREAERLVALRCYRLLDTPPDPAFDAFARLAADVCGVPMALVSLVDESRQFFKANVGLPGTIETPRTTSFCAHAICAETLFEIPDTTLDERFADNALVTGEPHVRFYAGMPLVDEAGHALGTLCVLDTRPRSLDDAQRATMQKLSTSLVRLIESRRDVATEALERIGALHGLLDNAAVPIAILRLGAGYPSFSFVNRAFTELFGYGVTDLVGLEASVLHGPDTDLAASARFRADVDAGRDGSETLALSTASGETRLVEIRDRAIDATYRIVSYRDLTNERAAREALAASNRRLQSLLDNNSDAVLTLDVDGRCIDVNAAAIEVFGRAREALLGDGYRALAPNGGFPTAETVASAFAAGRNVLFSAEFARGEGRLATLECKIVPMRDRDVEHGAYVIARDVTERRTFVAKLATQAHRLQALHRISISKASDSGQIDAILGLVLEAFDMDFAYVGEVRDETLRIRNVAGVSLLPVGATFPLAETHVRETLLAGDVLAISDLEAPDLVVRGLPTYAGWHAYISAPLQTESHTYGAIGFLARRVATFDESDRDFVRLVAGVVSSAVERAVKRERLDRLAYHDVLTDLPNRTRFIAELEETIARSNREGTSFALHFVDLDAFKTLNDTRGHAAGDLALQEAARRICEALRGEGDLPGRLGGDEFVILQRGLAHPDAARALATRVVEALARPYAVGELTFAMTASVGVALFPQDGVEASALLHFADVALYRAKRAGKNRIAFRDESAENVR